MRSLNKTVFTCNVFLFPKPTFYICIYIPRTLLLPNFPKFLFRLIGMVGEACLPSNACFPQRRLIILYLLWIHVYLSEHSKFCSCICRLYYFPNYKIAMLTSELIWYVVNIITDILCSACYVLSLYLLSGQYLCRVNVFCRLCSFLTSGALFIP